GRAPGGRRGVRLRHRGGGDRLAPPLLSSPRGGGPRGHLDRGRRRRLTRERWVGTEADPPTHVPSRDPGTKRPVVRRAAVPGRPSVTAGAAPRLVRLSGIIRRVGSGMSTTTAGAGDRTFSPAAILASLSSCPEHAARPRPGPISSAHNHRGGSWWGPAIVSRATGDGR